MFRPNMCCEVEPGKEKNVLEKAMDFDERKEPSPSEKAEIKSQIEALRKTYDMHEAEFLKRKRFIESEIAKLEKELMSAD